MKSKVVREVAHRPAKRLGGTRAVVSQTFFERRQRGALQLRTWLRTNRNLFPLAETITYGICCSYMIQVRHLSGDQYEVRVTDATLTIHQVTLKDADRVRLGGTHISGDELIAESFRFLLEREPNTSILRKFDLPVIGTYFPEYERDIRKRVAQR